jgi:hypothetical protein
MESWQVLQIFFFIVMMFIVQLLLRIYFVYIKVLLRHVGKEHPTILEYLHVAFISFPQLYVNTIVKLSREKQQDTMYD